MDANTVTAVCATGIAALSLAVSVSEGRAARKHSRISVRPALVMRATRTHEGRAGIRLFNAGLGPAVITASSLVLDGTLLGGWREAEVNSVRGLFPYRPGSSVFEDGAIVPTGYDAFLLSVTAYDPTVHGDFWHLIRNRLTLILEYESLYGGEKLRAVFGPHQDVTGPSVQP
ncbi:hypothetical protein [Streptomyces sp. HPF1205]|uniref:hypothetical protein n=1 Tax=Streptomyces sp. HPF1205 TaxID=2873262 RepID=UPI001CED5A24|nr:hypothetical protein [Streptomyces sp. HPF1205]